MKNTVFDTAKKMVDERANQATEAMGNMLNLRQLYAEMRMAGFERGAAAFRNHVFWMLMAKPDMTEIEIIEDIAKNLNIKIKES